MKFLMATEYYPPHWTGLAKSFHNLAVDLAREHEVTVLTTRFNDELATRETLQGVRIERAPYLFRVSRTQYSPQLLLEFTRLARDVDEVIINSPNSNVLFLAILARLFGKRLSIYHQGDLILPTHEGRPLRKLALEKTFDLLTIAAMWLAHRTMTYSRDYAESSRVMRFFLDKFQAVIPPIDVPGTGDADGTVARRLRALKPENALVGFAGRFVEEKGFDILLEAIPLVRSSRPGVKFVFAGETQIVYENFFGKLRGDIERNADSLVLLGRLDGDELAQFYRALDIFVLPSRSDCFALTQAEAALCGVPLVVSDIPGARAFVKGTGFGELVRPLDPAALAAGILHVLDHRAKYITLRNRVTDFLNTYAKAA